MLALGVLAVSCTVGTPETGYNEDGTLKLYEEDEK